MIVAVAGGKGGVGKSTTAWNLGFELEAVVVDADLSTADLPPGSGPNLHDVLAGCADPTEATETVNAVSVLPCGRTLSGARAAAMDELPWVLERLERAYDRVVVDCPAGVARDVGTVLRAVDLAVLVTTPERAALVDCCRTANLADSLETPVAALVLNMADRARHGSIADRLGRRLGVGVTIVDSQPVVADAQARWLPVRTHGANAQAVSAFRSVVDRLEDAMERHMRRSGAAWSSRRRTS
ncbi:chromosome partitioning protein ParA [Salinadaptatus halalkaliphilus]|uniref:Chromosome partitioning protein ParA n=1 Tax=Salinadaptatus halalkaliphilus TaxID=2419781 RepID=A0A4S3TTT0_9EURY|nr:P-loop NTPase [Salinadaptatus halalkaliphilus]THE66038.1 chromosome partitioning protein ParA [Salinadaptatus halalkaliphilus]